MEAVKFHDCAATGCQRRIPSHLLMCIDHWRMVPARVKREVLVAWQAWRRTVDPSGRHDAAVWHEAAKQKAVDAVAAKQAARVQKEPNLFG